MRKLLLCAALLALSACLRDIADTLMPSDDRVKPDTVVIVCRHYDPRPECQR